MGESRVVFGHTMEALLERCARDLPPDGWTALGRLGIERTRRLPAYDFGAWCEAVALLAKALHPGLEPGDAEFQLGNDFIERYAESFIGRALFSVLKLLGPRRVLGRMARSFRTGTNFTQVELTEETASSALMRIGAIEPRARFTHGLLTRGLMLAGIPTVRVQLEGIDGETATFRVSW